MDKRVLTTIGRLKDEMFLAERKVADYIAENPNQAVEMNVSELAEKSGASDATVIRLCKRLGYNIGVARASSPYLHLLPPPCCALHGGGKFFKKTIDKRNSICYHITIKRG